MVFGKNARVVPGARLKNCGDGLMGDLVGMDEWTDHREVIVIVLCISRMRSDFRGD